MIDMFYFINCLSVVGIPTDKLVEAHGTFMTATCLRCQQKYSCDDIRQVIFDDQVPKCTKTARCAGIIKPDITFFGEDLPRRFQLYSQDLPKCDCCIVMGTSLAVYPFADIVDAATRSTVRLLINRQIVGTFLSPRPNDMTMIGDLEMNIKELLTKLDAINLVMTLMKENHSEHEKTRASSSKTTVAKLPRTNDRLKAAEIYLEQRKQFSTLNHRRHLQYAFTTQSPAIVNESTKLLIEKHNNGLLLPRRRSNSAFPLRPSEQLSSSTSSSSTSESLNSSLSDSELKPPAFKRAIQSQHCSSKQPIRTVPLKGKVDPSLDATLRTVLE
jgi:hypothetical protein